MPDFGLNPQEIQNGDDNAKMNPYDPVRDSPAGFFEGSLSAAGQGLYSGEAMLAQLGIGTAQNLDSDLQSSTYFSGRQDALTDLIKRNRPDPQTTGWLGRAIYGLTNVAPAFVVGTATAGPMGGAAAVATTQGYSEKKQLESEGVDPATANRVGAVQGIFAGLGTLLPASFGGRIVARMAAGAALNVGVGGASRGLVAETLKNGGYDEMAQQYKILDGAAMFADAVLGGAFGALHAEPRQEGASENPAAEPSPAGTAADLNDAPQSAVDAALVANNWNQLELESAPGIPADMATRNAHVEAMNVATEQLMRGEPVDVSEQLQAANFIPKEGSVISPEDVRAAFDEEGVVQGELRVTPEEPIAKQPAESAPIQPSEVRESEPSATMAEDAAVAEDEKMTGGAERTIVAEKPSMPVIGDDGQLTTAAELLQKADDAVSLAEKDKSLYQVAVNCFLRNSQ